VPGAMAFCFDIQVTGDRHEGGFTNLPAMPEGETN
jgi:hypothetical protein